MKGKLFLCATPIGNLEDITLRVLRTLEEVDLIAAEDTRNSIKILNHFNIKTPMTSYHEHNKVEKAHYLVNKMNAGTNIALITDAGTPAVSDPGEILVAACYQASIDVTALPGASACITALTLSGLSTKRFTFEAFLPKEKKARNAILASLTNEQRTILIYESPHHLQITLKDLYTALGQRRITVCKELTKKYEAIFQTTFTDAILYYKENPPRGEYVIVIEGKNSAEILLENQQKWESITLSEHMHYYEAQGCDSKESMKLVAKDRGISKRDVYKMLLNIKNS